MSYNPTAPPTGEPPESFYARQQRVNSPDQQAGLDAFANGQYQKTEFNPNDPSLNQMQLNGMPQASTGAPKASDGFQANPPEQGDHTFDFSTNYHAAAEPKSENSSAAPEAPKPSAPAAATPPGSPVSATGQMQPASAPVAAAPAPQASQGFQAYTQQLQQQAAPASQLPPPPPPPDRNLTPLQVGTDPFASSQAKDFNGQLPTYQAQQFNGATPDSYTADKLAQFNGPDQTAQQNQQNALLQAIMANPHTLNADVVNQMKASGRDAATSMQDQLQGQADQNNASRGTLGSGAAQADQSNRQQQMVNQILSSNRNLDITQANQNRQDELGALNASDQVQQGQANRSIAGFGAQLAGGQAQAALNQAAQQSRMQGSQFDLSKQQLNADQLLKQFQSGQDQSRFGLDVSNANNQNNLNASQSQLAAQQANQQRLLTQFGMNQASAQQGGANYGQDLQAWIANNAATLANNQFNESTRQFNTQTGNQVDQFGKSFGEGQRQFNTGAAMNLAQFLEQQRQYNTGFGENQRQFNSSLGENARQFNGNLGFNYNQMDQNGQNALINAILGGGAR